MKELIRKVVFSHLSFKFFHFLNYDKDWSYHQLDKFGVEDIFKGKIIWKK